MTRNTSILFGFSASHSYFEQKLCTCLQYTAGKVTGLLQKRFDIKIESTINGFRVHATINTAVEDFLNYVKKTTDIDYFDFDITAVNPFFWAITELPENWVGQIQLDSQVSEPVDDENLCMLRQVLSGQETAEKAGSIKIHFEDILKKKGGDISFGIAFKARATQWNYYIINRSNMKFDNLCITEKSNSVSLEGPESVTVQNGMSALKFSSGSLLLPLSQVPMYKFDLVNNSGTNGTFSSSRPIFKGLPAPDPVRTDPVQISGRNKLASPMYIYI
jgi:hypothetical protein